MWLLPGLRRSGNQAAKVAPLWSQLWVVTRNSEAHLHLKTRPYLCTLSSVPRCVLPPPDVLNLSAYTSTSEAEAKDGCKMFMVPVRLQTWMQQSLWKRWVRRKRNRRLGLGKHWRGPGNRQRGTGYLLTHLGCQDIFPGVLHHSLTWLQLCRRHLVLSSLQEWATVWKGNSE